MRAHLHYLSFIIVCLQTKRTPLYFATYYGNTDTVKELVTAKANIHATDKVRVRSGMAEHLENSLSYHRVFVVEWHVIDVGC